MQVKYFTLRSLGLAIGLAFCVTPTVYASWCSATQPPPPTIPETDTQGLVAFSNDPSKPDPNIDLRGPEISTVPVSAESKAEWQVYNEPIRRCIQGNIILPSSGGDVFGYIFSNSAQTNINMAISGWSRNSCNIMISEGTNVMACQFSSADLNTLMASILMGNGFNRTGDFARRLSIQCQVWNPTMPSQ